MKPTRINKWTLLLMFLLPFTVSAQDEYSYVYGVIPDGKVTYLFGDNVNLREAPTTSSKSISKLKAGTEVEILSHGGLFRVNGLDAPWYEVRTGSSKGWIWGGFLALTAAVVENDLLLYGLTGFNPDSNFTGEVRYLKGNKVISSLSVQPYYTAWETKQEYPYSVKNTRMASSGLKGILLVWEVSFIYEACGYTSGEKYIAWNGSKLMHIGEAPDVSEAAVFHFESDMIFPWEEGGKTGQIICRSVTSEFDEELGDYKITETNEDIIQWDGMKFSALAH